MTKRIKARESLHMEVLIITLPWRYSDRDLASLLAKLFSWNLEVISCDKSMLGRRRYVFSGDIYDVQGVTDCLPSNIKFQKSIIGGGEE